jgi:hypothetical protein
MEEVVAVAKSCRDDPAGVEAKLHEPRRIKGPAGPFRNAPEHRSLSSCEDERDKDASGRTSHLVQSAVEKRVVEIGATS